jgi:hypothetical protein
VDAARNLPERGVENGLAVDDVVRFGHVGVRDLL